MRMAISFSSYSFKAYCTSGVKGIFVCSNEMQTIIARAQFFVMSSRFYVHSSYQYSTRYFIYPHTKLKILHIKQLCDCICYTTRWRSTEGSDAWKRNFARSFDCIGVSTSTCNFLWKSLKLAVIWTRYDHLKMLANIFKRSYLGLMAANPNVFLQNITCTFWDLSKFWTLVVYNNMKFHT